MNIVKILTQVINAALVHFASNKNVVGHAMRLLFHFLGRDCTRHTPLLDLIGFAFFKRRT